MNSAPGQGGGGPNTPSPKHGKHSVRPGDHIFFAHGDRPVAGEVIAHGEHGCTVKVGKGQHKVKWTNVLGHKARTKVAVKVVDEGEDGLLVEDDHGLRRFVRIEKPEPVGTMAKSYVGARLFVQS